MRAFVGIVFCVIGFNAAYAELAVSIGDTVTMSSYCSTIPGQPTLSLQEIGILESVITSSASTAYAFSVKGKNNDGWWKPFMPAEGIKVTISRSSSKPANVTVYSKAVESCTWISGISSDFVFISALEFYFPILDKEYTHADSFHVRLSDTIGLKCRYVQIQTLVPPAPPPYYECELIRYTNKQDGVGSPIAIPKAVTLTISDSNPFRFGGITANSQSSPYIGFDMSMCGGGYYSLDIMNYRTSAATSVSHSIITGSRKAVSVSHELTNVTGRRIRVSGSSSAPILGVNKHGKRIHMNRR